MKINPSRKYTTSIMGHPHFEGVLLKKDDVQMYVPKNLITKKGKIKQSALDQWNKLLKERAITQEELMKVV